METVEPTPEPAAGGADSPTGELEVTVVARVLPAEETPGAGTLAAVALTLVSKTVLATDEVSVSRSDEVTTLVLSPVRVWTLDETLSSHVSKTLELHIQASRNLRSRAGRAVGDSGSARGDGDHLSAVDGGLGIRSGLADGGEGRGNKASSKDHGTHLDGLEGCWMFRLESWSGRS